MNVQGLLKGKGNAVHTVGADATVADVVEALASHGVGALVVSGDGDAVDGIVSERDVVRALARQGGDLLQQPVSTVMTSEVVTCQPETTVEELAGTMTTHRIRHVPVLVDSRLCGIVSIGDVVKDRMRELETETQVLHEYIAHGR